MTSLRRFVARIRAVFGGSDLDRDFAAELQAHLEMLTEDNIRRGLAPDEARRQAALRLGVRSSLQSQHRDTRGFRPLAEIGQDARFAIRLMLKERWLSLTIITVLALGIGANTFGFALVNSAFWHGLPVPESDRLLMISWINDDGRREEVSHLELLEWRQAQQFEGLGGYQVAGGSLSDGYSVPERIQKTRITTNIFALLELHPSSVIRTRLRRW
jgi:macrolide transport system ATP-binding/permease protein